MMLCNRAKSQGLFLACGWLAFEDGLRMANWIFGVVAWFRGVERIEMDILSVLGFPMNSKLLFTVRHWTAKICYFGG